MRPSNKDGQCYLTSKTMKFVFQIIGVKLVVQFDDWDPVEIRKEGKIFPSCRIFPNWLELLRKKIRKCYTKLGKYETHFHIKYKGYEKKNCLLLVFLIRHDLLLNSELYKEQAVFISTKKIKNRILVITF